ncbi:MAG: hypothetical protein K0U41_09250, partial [Gammaproteobacteria bacterium]|nr:hypothetical protein [Gammaproteobacteria bacterium]
MAWTVTQTAGRNTYECTGLTGNTWASLHATVNANPAANSGTSVQTIGGTNGRTFYTIDLGGWGIEFGNGATPTVVTNADMDPLDGTIRTTKAIGATPVFLVNQNATVTIDSTVNAPSGITTAAAAQLAGANYFTPFFEATGTGNDGGWHHTVATNNITDNPSMFQIDGNATFNGLVFRVHDSPRTSPNAVGGMTNCIYIQTRYFATNTGSTGISRGSIFQKYDSATFSLNGTILIGGELLPNQTETFIGLTRTGSTTGGLNAGRAAGPITYVNPTFSNNTVDFTSENTGVGAQYPTTDIINNNNGFQGSYAWSAGSGTTAKGMIRFFKNITPNITDANGAAVANATFFLRDVDRGQRRSVPASSTLPATQGTSADALRALMYNQSKSYYVRTIDIGGTQTVFDPSTLIIPNDTTTSVATNVLPILIAVATWNAGDVLTTPFNAGGPLMDLRTKALADTASGMADTLDYVIWHYEDNPSIQNDVSFGGNGNLTIGDVLLPDNNITLNRNDVATLDLSLDGGTDIGITSTEITINTSMSDTQIYDIVKYRKEQRPALIEIPSASTLAVTRTNNTNDYGGRIVTLGGTGEMVGGNHVNIGLFNTGQGRISGLFEATSITNLRGDLGAADAPVSISSTGSASTVSGQVQAYNSVTLVDGNHPSISTISGDVPTFTNCVSLPAWTYAETFDLVINGGNTGFTITTPRTSSWNVTNVDAGNFNPVFTNVPTGTDGTVGIINITIDNASRDAVFAWHAALPDAQRSQVNILPPAMTITIPQQGRVYFLDDTHNEFRGSNADAAVAGSPGFAPGEGTFPAGYVFDVRQVFTDH